jgi:eukaryotic-like serine/threonine-protein kinase
MTMPLRPGESARLGRYELLGRLGQGGMGTVYLGRDESGRQVAIKMVRPEFAHDEEFRGRFRSEVNRARQVPPFSTAEVLDADPDHDPPYLVVEYVDGPSLAQVIQDRGPLTGSALHGVAVGIATALTAIHGAGVIHRDLKPGNVLVAMGGIKVIDFGIARAFEATSQHTRTDQMVGTVAYMAPERFSDDPVGPAADIFAWGAVVTYAATGRTPFAADSAPATAMRILTQPPELSRVPASLRGLVESALAKDPRDRPTARQLLDVLLAADGPPSAATVLGPPSAATVLVPAAVAPDGHTDGEPTARRRSKVRPTLIALVTVPVLLAGAAVFKFLPGLLSAAEPSGESAPLAAASSPAASRPAPSPSIDVHAEILRGHRRILLHVAEIDRDLALDLHSPEVEVADGTGLKSQFALIPMGVDFLIRTLRDKDEDRNSPSCLGVRIDPDRAESTLVAVECAPTKATVFSVTATGRKDDKGRPTYVMGNAEYGVVLWEPSDRKVVVAELGDFTPNLTVSLVDRGQL